MAYLGYVGGRNGVTTDPSKVIEIQNWKIPANLKELRGFLGLAGYYRKFVRNFGVIARPLTQLLKKYTVFQWTSETDKAFNLLKTALVSSPVLAIPDFTKPFTIETDASDNGIGAVLQQEGHPIAFLSKPLGTRTSGLSTYEKEYLAILMAVDRWRSYLQHAEYVIKTDQKSLIHLEEQRLSTPWQKKAFSKLLGLRYRIIYKQGKENAVVDALSRKTHASVETIAALIACQPVWLEDIIVGYDQDDTAKSLLASLAINPDAKPLFTRDKGLIRHNGRIWLGTNMVM